jgi:Ca-activated chloride channel homolog
MLGKRFQFPLALIALLCPTALSTTQEPKEDTVLVRTRVVFVDTLVQDKKTGAPVGDLTRENFEVLADGKLRRLSYFSRAGEGRRRPLALLLVLDLVARDTGEYLRRAEVLDSVSGALKQLSPKDEVALVVSLGGPGAPLKMLTDFTRDRMKLREALGLVRDLPNSQPRLYSQELENVSEVAQRAARERPDSQIIVLPLTSHFAPAKIALRDNIAAALIRSNVFYNPLISDAGKGTMRIAKVPGKYPAPPLPVLDALARLSGQDSHAPEYLAQQTGGETTRIHRPEDYGAALEKLIASLALRYNLGFTLRENEQDDGRLHKLEVRAKVRDPKGKERKLVVRARRGYYMKAQDVPITR